MISIELTAPAKVNLFLRVLGKRKDSYHNILTLFERISLADKIKISKIPKGIRVSSDKLITRNPKDNIAYKAAELLIKHKALKSGVKIDIKKRIPIAAGLGGGSSDAASVLIGINRLFDLKLKKEVLVNLAKQLGADVPFFILETPFAIGRSVGDRLEKVSLKIRPWHLLIYPGFHVSTKDIYKTFDFALTGKHQDAKIRFPLAYSMDFCTLESMLYNDLEKIVKSKKGVIDTIIRRLAYYLDKKAIVSGSGPSLFCLYERRGEAIKGKKRFLRSIPAREKKGWRVFIVRTEA